MSHASTYLTPEDMQAWLRIRKVAEEASRRHHDDHGHDLCPWGFGDASEHEAAFDYIEAVINATRTTPFGRFTWEQVDQIWEVVAMFSPPLHEYEPYNKAVAPLKEIAVRIESILPRREEAAGDE